MGLIYLDSCLLIYLVERHPRWGGPMAELIEKWGDAHFAISGLVKCECLVRPLKDGNLILRSSYLAVFERVLSLGIPEQVYLPAAELRARFQLRTPDALHLACAQHHHCDALWTNDDRLRRASRGLARNVLTV